MSKRIWAIGDVHGSYVPIENFWRRNKDNIDFSPEEDTLIVLGDFGANYFFNRRDIEFKRKLKKYNLTYFIVRGNHEERPSVCAAKYPDQWHTEMYFGNTVYVENDFPYIKYALDEPALYFIPYVRSNNDGVTTEVGEYKTLVIPGAYSVDKLYRLRQGWSWFEGEQLSPEEMETGRMIVEQNNHEVDLILSHTCPISYEPTDLFLSTVDQSMVDKTMERYLGEIEYVTSYKLWLWGHFHAHRIYPYNEVECKQCMMLFDKQVLRLDKQIGELPQIYKTF